MRKALLMSLLVAAPLSVLAQTAVRAQTVTQPEVIEAERNITPPSQVTVVQNSAPAVQAAPVAQVAAPVPQVVLTPAPAQAQMIQAQPAVRYQPVTVVEDTPLRESKADALRRSRVEVEQQTEQLIVEKIETERMKAEKDRADRFTKALEAKTEVAPAPVAPVQPVPIVQQPMLMQPVQAAPAPVVTVAEPQSVISADSILKEEVKKEEKSRVYVSAIGGVGDYPTVRNVKGIYSAGAGLGIIFPERLIAEGSVLFSSYDIEQVNNFYYSPLYPQITQMEQINALGAIKYQILEERIRPTVGVLGGYTRRTYTDKQYYYTPSSNVTSHAFDVGVSGGVDVEFAKNFALGADIKYLFNLSYRIDSDYQTSLINPQQLGKPIESLDYYLISVGARLTF